jgi:poly-gamma-glutamate capsule biosynthesis protein CapA/YwtB (metallophosphatase superfamily)
VETSKDPSVEYRDDGTAPAGNSPPTVWTTADASLAVGDTSPITIAFVGDIMLGRSLGERITDGRGATIFGSVKSILRSADVAVGNLECALGEGGTKAPKAYTFLAPPEAAAWLEDAGFDLLSLANNHSLDYGPAVLEQMMQTLDQAGIRAVGAGADEEQARAPEILDIGGYRLAFLAYVEVPVEAYGFDPKHWRAGPDSPGVSWADDARIATDLQILDQQVDFIVVLFHFGDEGMETPNRRQIQLSHLAIDNGADLVVGSHPHLVQAEEAYRSGWIFYSLGNFVFDGFTGKANHSAVLWTALLADGRVEYSWMPLVIVEGIPVIGE